MAMVTDPVCGMKIDSEDAVATADHQGTTYYFQVRARNGDGVLAAAAESLA